ncbi:PASTA domain-containing protein [Blastococcus brunescens]|uniref:PASTA domain-containing protein n=1 Tax=Blastococcus brunescens TaxID=1564165 RepID=A0ABZ1AZ63_9ACTN|nr:PASTA domain-containing protein [Blastococcus sp. BMG 8361]WRL63830.1 PASTA domain-containing protein [Blastococcus sp. BMG 8361]
MVDEGTEVGLTVGVAPDTIAVPNVVGLDEERARSTLEEAGFTSINSRQAESLEEEGQVVAVDPGEGEQVEPSTPLTLQVSTGTIEMPDVTGQNQDAATQTLQSAGISNIATEEVDSDQPAGTVVTSNPAAGNQVGADTRVVLQVSGGPAAEPMPDLIGVPEADARSGLVARGVSPADIVVQYVPAEPGEVPGEVVEQSVDPGTELTPGTTVTLTVAQ